MSDRSHDDRFSGDEGGGRTVVEPSGDRSGSRGVLLVGADRLADAAEGALGVGGASVVHLTDPRDPDIRAALEDDVDGAGVISRSDVVSRRQALVVAPVRPALPLLVNTFGRDVYRIAGAALAEVALGHDTGGAFPYRGTVYLVDRDGDIEPFVPVGAPAAT